MNNRIKELEMLCYEERGDYHLGSIRQLNVEKFAELLLRDVMETQDLDEWEREQLCELYGLDYKPTMMDHPEYGDLFSLDEWEKAMHAGWFNSDDGSGYWATKTQYAHVSCWDECPEWATHVLWFNK